MLEENAKFVEELTSDSVGMILKDDGKLRIFLKDHSNEKPEEIKYSNSELLMLALSRLLGNKEFVNGVMEMFFKLIDAQKKAINEAEAQRKAANENESLKSGDGEAIK